MKVAIIISGALRSFKTCYPGFAKYVLGPITDLKQGKNSIGGGTDAGAATEASLVDVYFHTWKMKLPYTKVQVKDEGTVEEAVKLYQPKVWRQDVYDQHMRDLLYSESGASKFQAEVRSMKLKARKDGRWGHHTKCDMCGHKGSIGGKCRICLNFGIHNVVAGMYSLRESYRLVESPESYSYIIRARFDLWHKEPLKIGPVAPMKLYLPDNGEKDFPEYGLNGIRSPNDQLAAGNPEVMAAYCSQYDDFYDLAMAGIRLGCGVGVPHLSIRTLAEKAGIEIVYSPHSYCLERKK